MENKKSKKIRWMKPKLEYLSGSQSTKGACENGSGNAGCGTGIAASTFCQDGTSGTPLFPSCFPFGDTNT